MGLPATCTTERTERRVDLCVSARSWRHTRADSSSHGMGNSTGPSRISSRRRATCWGLHSSSHIASPFSSDYLPMDVTNHSPALRLTEDHLKAVIAALVVFHANINSPDA